MTGMTAEGADDAPIADVATDDAPKKPKFRIRSTITNWLTRGSWLERKIQALENSAPISASASDASPDLPTSVGVSAIDKKADKIKSPIWPLLSGLVLVLGTGAAKPLLPEFPHGSPSAYWSDVLPLFVAELGVAFMVAYFIGLTIDSQVKSREERQRKREKVEAVEREQRMVQDVFRGVLGIRHSTPYVRKVVETNLEQRVVRESVALIYTLRHLTKVERDTIGDGRFLILDQTISFTFENLSSDDVLLPVRFVVPVRHGEKLRNISKLTSVVLDEEPLKIVEPPFDPASDAKEYSWKRKLRGGTKMSIVVNAIVVKEESDTEVWCSYYPCTRGMTLQVTAPPELNLGIRNNTASKHVVAKKPEHTGTGLWKIEGPILPNDSVVFFWRTDRDEGEPTGRQRGSTAPDPLDEKPSTRQGPAQRKPRRNTRQTK